MTLTDPRPDVDTDDTPADRAFRRDLGARLRDVRRHRRLSLLDVEAATGEEFKGSVLGAYERGERAISSVRLHRLLAYYGATIDDVWPDATQVRAGAAYATQLFTAAAALDGLAADLRGAVRPVPSSAA